MNEEQAAAKFLRDTLRNNEAVAAVVGTRVYQALADLPAAYPLAIFNMQSGGNDRNRPGADGRMMSRGAWLVKAVTDSNGFSEANALASLLDSAIVGATGQVEIGDTTYTILSIYRLSPVSYVEPVGGKRYFHVGGLYRIQVTGL